MTALTGEVDSDWLVAGPLAGLPEAVPAVCLLHPRVARSQEPLLRLALCSR